MKLSIEALKERAGAVASVDLLNSISGGTEDACHPTPPVEEGAGCPECPTSSSSSQTPLAWWLLHLGHGD